MLELAEHTLDAVAIAIAAIVGMLRDLTVRARRDRHQRLGCGVIGSLTAGHDEADRQSLIVTAGVDFARKSAG